MVNIVVVEVVACAQVSTAVRYPAGGSLRGQPSLHHLPLLRRGGTILGQVKTGFYYPGLLEFGNILFYLSRLFKLKMQSKYESTVISQDRNRDFFVDILKISQTCYSRPSVYVFMLFHRYLFPSIHIALLLKFADDIKVANRVTSLEDRRNLQNCLNNLTAWADTWSMSFNTDKCKILHVGRNNPRQEYTMYGTKLAETEKERDIGVIINHDLISPVCRGSQASHSNIDPNL